MYLRAFALASTFVILAASTPAAADGFAVLPERGAAVIAALGPDDELLSADGRVVKPAAIRLPGVGEPLAQEAAASLRALLAGRAVTLRGGPDVPDRHGRTVAHLVRDDGLWAQAELLRLGWARLFPEPEDAPALPALLAAEREAQVAGRGLWGHPAYAVRTPARLEDAVGGWQVVRGKVLKAARVGERVYLNFGRDYRSDFTVEIESAELKAFAAAGIEPLKLAGRMVEARGLVEERNGPAIAIATPVRLRLLD